MALTATQPRLGRLERAALQGVIVREVVNYSSFWRSSTFSSTVDPTIYLLAFGFGFGSLVSTVAGYDYIDFVGTGIVATTVLFSGAFPAMYSTFVKYEFQHTYDAILAAPVDTEELVTAEAPLDRRADRRLRVRADARGDGRSGSTRAGGCCSCRSSPALAGHRLGLLRHLHRGEVEGDRELLVLAERPADADVPRRRHVLPARRAADVGPDRRPPQPAVPLRRARPRTRCSGSRAGRTSGTSSFLVGFALVSWRLAIKFMERKLIL